MEKKVKQIKNLKYQITDKIFLMLYKSPIRKTFLSFKSNIQYKFNLILAIKF